MPLYAFAAQPSPRRAKIYAPSTKRLPEAARLTNLYNFCPSLNPVMTTNWQSSKRVTQQNRQYTYIIMSRRAGRGKAISIQKYYEHVSVFFPQLSGMQIPTFLRSSTLSSMACLAVPYFSTLSHKRHDCRKKILTIKRVFWFSL
jgi:hypothetical protein